MSNEYVKIKIKVEADLGHSTFESMNSYELEVVDLGLGVWRAKGPGRVVSSMQSFPLIMA
jgi:hypothetical protein